MKRPFALIGITYLSVQAALFYLESDLAATILTAVCFIETIVSLFILKNRNLRAYGALLLFDSSICKYDFQRI